MKIDFTPLLTLPRREKLALVKLLVESMESEELKSEQSSDLSSEQIKKVESTLKRIAQGEIRFYPWSEARSRLYKLADE